MKNWNFKKIAIRLGVVLGVVLAIALLWGAFWLLGRLIFFPADARVLSVNQIQRVEFRGWSSCGGPVSDTVELSESEIREMVKYYHKASFAGEVSADNCDSEFAFRIYLKNGKHVYLSEAFSPRIEVSGSGGRDIWVRSKDLAAYAQELIEKYGLMASPEE